MTTTLFQLASRIDLGSPVRRRYQMPRQRPIETPSTRFDLHLQHEGGKTEPPTIRPSAPESPSLRPSSTLPSPLPPSTESPTMKPPAIETQTEEPPAPPPAASNAMRTRYRQSYMHGFIHMRQTSPQTHQYQMGWVMTRLSRALTDNPYMSEQEIESLVDGLLAGVPEYEIPE